MSTLLEEAELINDTDLTIEKIIKYIDKNKNDRDFRHNRNIERIVVKETEDYYGISFQFNSSSIYNNSNALITRLIKKEDI